MTKQHLVWKTDSKLHIQQTNALLFVTVTLLKLLARHVLALVKQLVWKTNSRPGVQQ